MKRVLCWLGRHDWVYFMYASTDRNLGGYRKCARCSRVHFYPRDFGNL